LQLDLPHTSVRDAIVHGDDLVVATHGRGFWILDDVTPLRQIAARALAGRAASHLFAPATAYRVRRSYNTDTPLQPDEPSGENPPDGAMLDYWLAKPAAHVALSIFDASGRLVRRYASDDAAPAPIADLDKPRFWERSFTAPPTGAGMHRFVWDLREPAPRSVQQDLPISAVPHKTPRVPEGPLIAPGSYAVELEVDGAKQRSRFTVAMDPRVAMTQAQLAEQYTIAHALAAMMDASYDASVAASKAGHKEAAARAETLNGRLAALLGIIDDADAPPTAQALEAYRQLRAAAVGRAPVPQVWHADEP